MKDEFKPHKRIVRFIIMCLMVTLLSCTEKAAGPEQYLLHDGWEFRKEGDKDWAPATVPGTVHTDLLTNGMIGDPFYRTNEQKVQWIEHANWNYRTDFDVDGQLLKRTNIELEFEGLDTYADIYLNDELLFSANNMFRTWRIPVRELIRQGQNSLQINFSSPITTTTPVKASLGYEIPISDNDAAENKLSVFSRKAPYHFGWDWGPRMVTAGIWREVRLVAWDNTRINHVRIAYNGIEGEKASMEAELEVVSDLEFEGTIIVQDTSTQQVLYEQTQHFRQGTDRKPISFTIPDPELWWPNGMGAQKLYGLEVRLLKQGRLLDSKTERIGLRTIEIKQIPDSTGRSFEIWVNGTPVFMKGGNYIPMDSFTPRVKKQDYERLVLDCKEANMNMLRVWGGGIYEQDHFYELCDEHGLLVWQDFMFACSMYPADEAFLDNLRHEFRDNIIRLRNHASLALWCGNNEVEEAWHHWGWKENYPDTNFVNYKKIFHEVIPEQVKTHDPGRFYLSSSPTSGSDTLKPRDARYGDLHYWGVWHQEHPFDHFLKDEYTGRFMSEYGLQSFPSMETVQAFALPEDHNIESDVMKLHQKNNGGNRRIKNYMEKYYGTVENFGSFLYVSQLQQAEAMKIAVEHHRRMMPYTMGSLYWQINDCWPAASWAGLDYFGGWKALQYYARDFFNPVLASPTLESGHMEIHAISDLLKPREYHLEWYLLTFQGDTLKTGTDQVTVESNQVTVMEKVNLNNVITERNQNTAYGYVRLTDDDGTVISENRLFFTEFKHLQLTEPIITWHHQKEDGQHAFVLKTDRFVKNVYLTLEGHKGRFSENFFDLNAGETKKHPEGIGCGNKCEGRSENNGIKYSSMEWG